MFSLLMKGLRGLKGTQGHTSLNGVKLHDDFIKTVTFRSENLHLQEFLNFSFGVTYRFILRLFFDIITIVDV